MVNRKSIRTRGKIQLSKYFQELEPGESVAVIREKAISCNFPAKLQGRTGVVEGKRGRACLVKLKDTNKEKIYLIEPVHLRRIKNIETKK